MNDIAMTHVHDRNRRIEFAPPAPPDATAPPTPEGLPPSQVPITTIESESANPHEVRNPDLAAYWRDRIRTEVLDRFPDLDAAIAAGYAPTQTGVNPVHYNLGGYEHPDPSRPDGGISDLSRPYSLVVDNGKIVGVMLRAPGGAVEFGAGEWHTHDHHGGGTPLMHVFFDRPLDEAFGGHVPGLPVNPDQDLFPDPKPGIVIPDDVLLPEAKPDIVVTPLPDASVWPPLPPGPTHVTSIIELATVRPATVASADARFLERDLTDAVRSH